jgi:small conductance mechanosensitive channel
VHAGVMRQVRSHAAARARRARAQVVLLLPLLTGVVLAYVNRDRVFGLDLPIRIACVVALVVLGWAFTMNLGRAVGPMLTKRVEPGTAGTVGFLIRLGTLVVTVLVALRARRAAAGDALRRRRHHRRDPRPRGAADDRQPDRRDGAAERPTLQDGGPVRVHAGGVAGTVEGMVNSLGLLYTTLANGEDRIMVPNNVVLSAAVVPLREPSGVDLLARLGSDVRPSEVHRLLEDTITVDTRTDPEILLEEMDGDRVIVRVRATPAKADDGPALADQVVGAPDKVSNGRNVG